MQPSVTHPTSKDDVPMDITDKQELANSEPHEHLEDVDKTQCSGGPTDRPPLMRSQVDNLSVWESVKRYKVVGMTAMLAAFCASLDGYQINLNGGIVANKGFVHQMMGPRATIIQSQYVSAWGGIQSAGQAVGQFLLQFVTESFGRKAAMYIIWLTLVISIFVESFANTWYDWLIAKLFAGLGVGMLQSTLPLYLSEIAPTQLRGFYINAYSFWFVLGQLFASLALNRLAAVDPLDFRVAIYTQWAMIGVTGLIFAALPESPWWLASKGKFDRAEKILQRLNGRVQGFDASEQVGIMSATIAEERRGAEANSQTGPTAVFQGRNCIRFIIATWPKITQQLVGLTVFNTYAVYFFQYAGNKNPFLVTVILSCVQILSMLVTATMTDQFGRRPLTVYPYAVTVVSVLCLGIIGCFDYTQPATSSLLIFFACLATFSTTGASAIGYAYAAEIPAQHLRARTAAWALTVSNLVGILFSFCTPLMISGAARWGVKTGFFFAGTGTVAVAISWFILPEITRRTPSEINEMFEKRVNLRKFHHFVTDVKLNADQQAAALNQAKDP